MIREDIIEVIAENAEMTKKQAGIALNTTLDSITQALQAGERITFIGFGTFSVKTRNARKGINPKTKEKIDIAASKVPVFRPGTKLKTLVNE